MLATVCEMTIVASVAVALSQLDGTHSSGWRQAVRDAIARAAVNPFVVSIVVGAVFRLYAGNCPRRLTKL
jgi:hypothetical protein